MGPITWNGNRSFATSRVPGSGHVRWHGRWAGGKFLTGRRPKKRTQHSEGCFRYSDRIRVSEDTVEARYMPNPPWRNSACGALSEAAAR